MLQSRSGFRKKTSNMLKAGRQGRYYFTLHAEYKMREYHLSRQRVTRIIRSPHRTETGIVENTIAVMQPASTKTVNGTVTWTQELWVMYKINKQKTINSKQPTSYRARPSVTSLLSQPELKIISAWRYPGVSPERDPIPAEILREIEARSEEEEEGE